MTMKGLSILKLGMFQLSVPSCFSSALKPILDSADPGRQNPI
jgi:hypothetical protein